MESTENPVHSAEAKREEPAAASEGGMAVVLEKNMVNQGLKVL